MSSTIIVPQGFSYVGGALLSTTFLLIWQSSVVGKYRKLSGVKYPQLYAEKAEAAASQNALKFNCAQRAHQNTLEYYPIVIMVTVISGLSNPILSASLCGSWIVSRIIYTLGYTTGIPEKRNHKGGNLGILAALVLLGNSIWTVGKWVAAGV